MKITVKYDGIEFTIDPDEHQILINGKVAAGEFAPVGGVVVEVNAQDDTLCKVVTDLDDTPEEKKVVYGIPLEVKDKVIILKDYIIPANAFFGELGNGFADVAISGSYNDLRNKPSINGQTLQGNMNITVGGGGGGAIYQPGEGITISSSNVISADFNKVVSKSEFTATVGDIGTALDIINSELIEIVNG
jgi:hypothetical protein